MVSFGNSVISINCHPSVGLHTRCTRPARGPPQSQVPRSSLSNTKQNWKGESLQNLTTPLRFSFTATASFCMIFSLILKSLYADLCKFLYQDQINRSRRAVDWAIIHCGK